jgi:hypothetical protein
MKWFKRSDESMQGEFAWKFKFNQDSAKSFVLTGKNYQTTFEKLKTLLRNDYLTTKEKTVWVSVGDSLEKELKFKYFFFYMIYYRFFVKEDFNIYDTSILSSEIFSQDSEFNKKNFIALINDLIDTLRDLEVPISVIREEIAFILKELVALSALTAVTHGSTINLYSLIQLANKNPRFKELLHYKLDPTDPIFKSEEDLESVTKEFIGILKTEENSLRPFLLSEIGIKEKQLRECFLNIGYKPDLLGNIIKRPINTSFAMGLKHSTDFYNNCVGSRKALIVNFKAVKSSGYFTRKLLLLLLDVSLDNTVEDCGTTHYLQTTVSSEEHFTMLHGKYFLNDKGLLEEINKDNKKQRKALLHKEISLRSPVTCALPDYKICRTCYGKILSDINGHLRIGILSTLLLTSQLTQNLLSSKHLLRIKTKELLWDEKIKELFIINKNDIRFNEDFPGVSIKISTNNLDLDENNKLMFQEFSIEYAKKSYPVKSPILLELPIKYYESNDDSLDITITAKEYRGGFKYTVENQEFSKSLKNIIKLLDTNNHLLTKEQKENSKTEFDNIYSKIIELLVSSKINLNSAHIELILKRLIREKNNHDKYLDFSKEELDDFVVLRLTDAIINNPSIGPGLSFERIKQQLFSPEFFKRSGTSIIDKLYG